MLYGSSSAADDVGVARDGLAHHPGDAAVCRAARRVVLVQLDNDDGGRPRACSAYESDSAGVLAGGRTVGAGVAPEFPPKRNSELICTAAGSSTTRRVSRLANPRTTRRRRTRRGSVLARYSGWPVAVGPSCA